MCRDNPNCGHPAPTNLPDPVVRWIHHPADPNTYYRYGEELRQTFRLDDMRLRCPYDDCPFFRKDVVAFTARHHFQEWHGITTAELGSANSAKRWELTRAARLVTEAESKVLVKQWTAVLKGVGGKSPFDGEGKRREDAVAAVAPANVVAHPPLPALPPLPPLFAAPPPPATLPTLLPPFVAPPPPSQPLAAPWGVVPAALPALPPAFAAPPTPAPPHPSALLREPIPEVTLPETPPRVFATPTPPPPLHPPGWFGPLSPDDPVAIELIYRLNDDLVPLSPLVFNRSAYPATPLGRSAVPVAVANAAAPDDAAPVDPSFIPPARSPRYLEQFEPYQQPYDFYQQARQQRRQQRQQAADDEYTAILREFTNDADYYSEDVSMGEGE